MHQICWTFLSVFNTVTYQKTEKPQQTYFSCAVLSDLPLQEPTFIMLNICLKFEVKA